MMKLIIMMIFMIPLILLNFWLNFFCYFMLMMVLFLIIVMNNYWISISYTWSMDLLSYIMIILTIWICLMMILSSMKINYLKNNNKLFLFTLLMLLFSLIMTFISVNLFMFYLFFEMSLIPTIMLILGWGYQPERIQASIYLLFYTLLASLPMLLAIFYWFLKSKILNFLMLQEIDSLLMYFMVNLIFLVKIPLYMFHLWLPKAHVEAPISGSMILAGVMLKLGGYGLMRLMILFKLMNYKINYMMMIFSLMGGIFVSLICLIQYDIKMLIAYSSVAHMSMVLSSIFSLKYISMCGALIMMVAHGLCSSGLFCLSNMFYERFHSRSLFILKGLINILPSLSMWMFLFCASNMAAPPSLNLLSELMMLSGLMSWSYLLFLLLMILSLFSAIYSLFLYSYCQHGINSMSFYNYCSGKISEYFLLFLHWVPLNILILKIDIFYIWY
uniref:NADH-ubiquinone oxidoreductase chain 4 n=1 Tax=Stenus clavicornis TaxID=1202167 RepID=A0A191ZS12_9COLE|nr:NADH dehydrogenase subunit 4 [Stenus clavicornis]